jgi:hypothetical protein
VISAINKNSEAGPHLAAKSFNYPPVFVLKRSVELLIVKMLFDAGVDLYAQNRDTKTAFDVTTDTLI